LRCTTISPASTPPAKPPNQLIPPRLEQQIGDGLFAQVLEDPEQSRTCQPSDDAGDGCVHSFIGQPGEAQLSTKHPETDERADSNQNTKAK
jgi:hypothetical protein